MTLQASTHKTDNGDQMTGFFIIYKEAGFTSHDVVAKMRGILHTKRVGHTGTLDPDATGVLPIAVGRATKAIELLPDHSKAYAATMLLGTQTDTYDTSGTVTATAAVTISEEEVRKTLVSFVGEYDQLPPMYSAKKVDGKRLYELARKGITAERKAVRVRIDAIRITEIALPYVKFEVECAKGTYIRSLCQDVGAALGCGGCMDALVRTRAGRFLLADAHTLGELEQARDAGKLMDYCLPLTKVFEQYPRVEVPEGFSMQAMNGAAIPINLTDQAEPLRPAKSEDVVAPLHQTESENAADPLQKEPPPYYRLFLHDGRFLGLYSCENGIFRIKKMFLE